MSGVPEDIARKTPLGFAWYTERDKYDLAPHLELINAKLMDLAARRIKLLCVAMPPRHGKSVLISTKFSTWWMGTFPGTEVIVAGYQQDLAAKFGLAARDTMKEWGASVFNATLRSDKHGASDWRVTFPDKTESGFRAIGVGTGVMGRGGDLIVVDDPIKDAKEANSETYRNNVWEWYTGTLVHRLNPNGVMLVVMTRWHEDDLIGRLLVDQPDAEYLSLPALAEPDDVLGREVGDALWPAKWATDALKEREGQMSAYWWNALFQQRPSPPEGHVIKRQWIKFWKPADRALAPPIIALPGEPEWTAPVVDRPKHFDQSAFSWDLGFKKGATTSFIEGQAWGRKGADAYLLDERRDRMDFVETVEAFVEFCRKHNTIEAKWVEDKANAAALYSVLKDQIAGIVEVPVEGGDKVARALAAATYWESGNVYLPHPAIAPWVYAFIEEIVSFPAAKHNDRVDAMSQALRKLLAVLVKAPVVGPGGALGGNKWRISR